MPTETPAYRRGPVPFTGRFPRYNWERRVHRGLSRKHCAQKRYRDLLAAETTAEALAEFYYGEAL